MPTAKLPPSLVAPKPRRFGDLKDGETAYMWFVELLVDEDLSCYINPEGEVRSSAASLYTMEVRRDLGEIHVTVDSDLRCKPRLLDANKKAYPVASITVVDSPTKILEDRARGAV